jgi:hypothetical protein
MSIRTILELIGAAIGAVILWFGMQRPAPVIEPRKAEQAPEIAAVPSAEIHPAKVKVKGSSAKKKLNLPADVQANDALHVMDSAVLPPEDRDVTVTHLIDENTGETQTLVEEKPYPLIEAENDKTASFAIGVKNGGKTVVRLTLVDDLVQVKAVHFGAMATADSDGALFLGVGISYRWK